MYNNRQVISHLYIAMEPTQRPVMACSLVHMEGIRIECGMVAGAIYHRMNLVAVFKLIGNFSLGPKEFKYK